MLIGKTLRSRYKIIKELGRGGFGVTYLAEDIDLPGHPHCVVKHLTPSDPNPAVFPIAKKLFDREAEFLYRLGKHDQIPTLYAHFSEGGEFYLVEEFVEGDDLSKEIVPQKPLSSEQTVKLLREILEVLAVVHQQNVIHRDIKPQNIIRRKRDRLLVLIDFGAVKEISALTSTIEGQTSFTVGIGSPGYMPSEQASGKPKLASDVYAVGMIGIQALTGVKPNQLKEDTNTGEIIWRNWTQVSERLADILTKMVRDHFSLRYKNASEALQALQSIAVSPTPTSIPESEPITAIAVGKTEPKRIVRHFPMLFGLGMALIVIAAGGGYSYWQWRENQPLVEYDRSSTPSPTSPVIRIPERINLSWAISFGGSSDRDLARGIALDSTGNPYITGFYRGDIDIDQNGTYDLTDHANDGPDSFDFFITQFDGSRGTLLQADGFGSSGWDLSSGITLDGQGNVYTASSLQGPFHGGGYKLNLDGKTITTKRYEDPFVTKFDDSGNLVWVNHFGNSRDRSSESAHDVAVDSANQQVYVVGRWHYYSDNYWPELDIRGKGDGHDDAYLAAFDNNSGNLLWARDIGGTSGDQGLDVAVDGAGNIYITGYFDSSNLQIDGAPISLTNQGSRDAFIVKYDPSGTFLWATSIGGPEQDYINDVAVDSKDNVYIAGQFEGSVNIGGINFTSNGLTDAFVAKYDSNGNLLWAKSFGDSNYDAIASLAVDSENNLYVGGGFRDTLDIDKDGTNDFTSKGESDVFIAKYDSSGNLLGASSFGGTGIDGVSGIAVDSAGNAYITGIFQNTMDVGGTTLTSNGGSDVYTAKWLCCQK
ncbi:MAG: SBBP repeat-containing protein [Xenococcaceae cyanobacterium]